MLGSLLVLVMLLIAACGGDDDDDDDDDAGAAGSTPTATATMADADDGGDDDDDDSSNAATGGGEFGSYASDLCTAIDDFVQTLPSLMNQQQFAAGNFKSIAEPYSDLADALEEARPPDALAEYHAALR